MSTKYFNFRHEENLVELNVNDETGRVEVRGVEFDSVEEFAEQYALARDVRPDQFKNWALTQNGDTYIYDLRAATAGNNLAAIATALREAGFTPEEVAKALAAQQALEAAPAPVAVPDTETARAVREFVANNESNLVLLSFELGIPDVDGLIRFVEAADLSDYIEYEDDFGDIFERDTYEATSEYLYDKVFAARQHLNEELPDVPVVFAALYKLGRLAEVERHEDLITQVFTTVEVSGRPSVQIVTITDGHSTKGHRRRQDITGTVYHYEGELIEVR
jgi:hypothetical protein